MMRSAVGLAALAAVVLAAAPARAEPPVWIVRDADSEVVLFGSIHVLPPGLAWRPAKLEAALNAADDLWFELPVGPDTEQEVARLAGAAGFLASGQSLFELLGAEDGARLMRIAADYGLDPHLLVRLKPWLAEVSLGGAVYARSGARYDLGVEAAVSAAAPPTVRREAFETPREQVDLFDQTPMSDQLASLRATIREIETQPEAFEALIAAWMAGDTAGLEGETLAVREASPLMFRRLIADRNARWTRSLDARLKGSGRTVVVVGVGHLVGSEGVPARLRALGYSVTGP